MNWKETFKMSKIAPSAAERNKKMWYSNWVQFKKAKNWKKHDIVETEQSWHNAKNANGTEYLK